MSWPLASFVLVAAVLAAGWLAYERRRPSARMAAVVAVMAALAALGRDAFAALPDVKPITAMTLVTGYALGPIPGFTVGALGMLVSNFLLGQGPYTPWQMAAWGMVGLGGAALGALTGRRLTAGGATRGRVALACVCALAALAAKEVMNVYTWTLGASHTPAAFLAVAGQALAYDITDVVASFAFGLAFAPELARVLARTRMRMDVVWDRLDTGTGTGTGAVAVASGAADASAASRAARPAAQPGWAGPGWRRPHARPIRLRTLLAGLAAAAAIAVAGVALAGGSRNPAPARAAAAQPGPGRAVAAGAPLTRLVAYLVSAQNRDGGFGGARGQATSELYSAWAAMGLAAAGRSPVSVRRSGRSVLDAVRAQAGSLEGTGDLERTILALAACGAPARALPGLAGGNPVKSLLRARGRDGSFGRLANLTAFAILALRAAGYPARNPVIAAAARWLERQQDTGGGFGFAGGSAGGPVDVDDTAAAVQALRAAGAGGSASVPRAVRFLLSAQNLDGGFPQQPGGESNAQSTAWAVQGLIAAGRDPASVRRSGSRSPVAYIESLITGDGSVRYSRTGAQTPVWVTAQALTALAGKPLPILKSGRG